MNITCRKVTTVPEFIDGIRLRVQAFIIEQNCAPGWEPDQEDRVAEHYIASRGNEVVAVLRVRTEDVGTFKIERMVTSEFARGQGIGRKLLSFVLSELATRNPKKIWMQAQVQAGTFYEKCGFCAKSDRYDLYGIPHLDMEYVL